MKMAKSDLSSLAPGALEAIAALIGISHISRIPLLEEMNGLQSNGYKYQRKLNEMGKEAFTSIYDTITSSGDGRHNMMDIEAFKKLHKHAQTNSTGRNNNRTEQNLISEFEKISTLDNTNGYISLEQFLAYIVDGYVYDQR